MKQKRRIAVVCMILGIIITGCGDTMKVEDYPLEKTTVSKADDSDTTGNDSDATENDSDTMNNDVSEGEHLRYDIFNARGSRAFKVDAVVTGDDRGDYVVYEIEKRQITEEMLGHAANTLFEEGSVSLVMPYWLADINYINDRIDKLHERRDVYEQEGKKIPNYLEEELDNLESVRDKNDFSERYTMSCPESIEIVSLDDYYATEKEMDVSVKFCYLEGKIENHYYRLDYMNYGKNDTIRLYREYTNADKPEGYILASNEKLIPGYSEEGEFNREVARESAENLVNKLQFDYMDISNVAPAYEFGSLDEVGNQYARAAYHFFFATEVNGMKRACTELTDYFGDNIVATHFMFDPQNIMFVDQVADSEENVLAISTREGTLLDGYESVGVCVDEEGIVEMYVCNPTDIGSHMEQNVSLISFEDADERARGYMKYLADNKEEGKQFTEKKIEFIELSMCRVEKDGKYYMTPAWYYFIGSTDSRVLRTPAVVVNATDGSIIDVSQGGVLIDY